MNDLVNYRYVSAYGQSGLRAATLCVVFHSCDSLVHKAGL